MLIGRRSIYSKSVRSFFDLPPARLFWFTEYDNHDGGKRMSIRKQNLNVQLKKMEQQIKDRLAGQGRVDCDETETTMS